MGSNIRLLEIEQAWYAGLTDNNNNDDVNYLEDKNNVIERLRGKRLEENE